MKRLSSLSEAATTGFTIIEVLVVMIIVGILMGIAAPNWIAYLSNRRVVTVRDEVKQVLEDAQNRARAERQSRIVTIYDSESLPTVSISSTTGTAIDNQQTLGGTGIRENMIGLSTSGSTTLTFDYQGLVDDSAALPFVIEVDSGTFASGRKRCVIVATLLGSIVTGDGDDECDPANFIAD